MKSNNKGQAALEFMMTYGWAILVVLAAIGALSYFGVLNPSKFTPDTCVASAPFSCPGKPVISTSQSGIYFSIVNGQGFDINLTNNPKLSGGLDCNPGSTTVALCAQGSTSCAVNDSHLIPAGQGATIIIGGCNGLATTNVVKGDITFNYTNPESKLSETFVVSVTGKPKN